MLLLHGWGSSAKLMRSIAERLSDRYRIYNIDLPGHGNSPAPPTPWGVPQHAELVDAYIQEYIAPGPRALTLIGHSNGGRIGLYMASTPSYSDRFGRMVLISPSGVKPERSFQTKLRSGIARALKAPFIVLPEPPREFMLDWLRHSLVWKALGSSDYRNLTGTMRDTFVKTVNFHMDEELSRIDIPVLIFWGTEDTAVSERQIRILDERIPDAGVVRLEGAGHYGYIDQPQTVLSSTRHFLNRVA